MGKTGCAVQNCAPNKNCGRHRFPQPQKYPAPFRGWLGRCGNKYIAHLTPEYIYIHYRICSKHFTDACFGPNHKLKTNVYPTLHLPETENAGGPAVHQDHSYARSNTYQFDLDGISKATVYRVIEERKTIGITLYPKEITRKPFSMLFFEKTAKTRMNFSSQIKYYHK